MDFSFNAEIAAQYGVEEAVFIHNLYWWITKNKANNRHFYDGKFWTYNTAKAFSELFSFWSERQIRRIIKKLQDQGVLYIGNFNPSTYDRTQWYALDDAIYDIYQNGNMHVTKRSDASDQTVTSMLPNGQMDVTKRSLPCDQTVTPIPDSKPDINTDSKPDKEAMPLSRATSADYEAYRKAFIECCPSLPHPQPSSLWSAARKKAIRAKGVSVDGFRDICKKIEQSDFLTGRDGKWQGCSIDWILKPGNWAKILEGNYDNRNGCPSSRTIRSPSYDIEAYERSSIFDDVPGGDASG